MSESYSASYAAAGVDITAGYRAVELMKSHVARTMTAGVCGDIGGFGGLYQPELSGMSQPVLVSGTDGVGTKLRVAQLMNRHDTVGIDCVAMCVNDIICCGARPLFFLDYIACGKNIPERIADIVGGVAEGCVQAGCALIGGETAEHPGVMHADDYDLAGFAVGIVDREKIIDKNKTAPGDAVLALPSSGVHSNGFSLVRRVFNVERADLHTPIDALGGLGLGQALLTPTRIYVKAILALLEQVEVHGISHIHFRSHRRDRRHPGAGHVQHLQHGGGHDRDGAQEPSGQGSLPPAGKRRGRLPHRRDRLRRGAGGPMLTARIAVLVSGGGTNLQALIDAQRRGDLHSGVLSLVIADKSGVRAVTRAHEADIACAVIPRREPGFEEKVLEALGHYRIDMVVLAGFLGILSADFIAQFPGPIINIHPSLIPAFCGKGFYGLKVHQAALDYGVKVTGATVHYVNEVPDGGKIILQKAVEVQPGDTAEVLQRRVMEQAEWVILPQAAELVAQTIMK